MHRRTLIAASAAVVAAMAAASLVAGSLLPPGIGIAVHWNAGGVANGFAPKWVGLFITPGLAVFAAVLLAVLPRIEARRSGPGHDGLARSAPLYAAAWAGILALLVVVHGVILAAALGAAVPVVGLVLGGVGALFVAIGNYLPKSRPTFTLGIRTPWTLDDEDVWIATHRLAGKLMAGGGLALIVVAWARPAATVVTPFVLAAVAVATVVPVAYSYAIWRRKAGAA